jgi:hypothetical protein
MMSKAGRIGAILILTLGLLDLTAILFASSRSCAEPVRPVRAALQAPLLTAPVDAPDLPLQPIM